MTIPLLSFYEYTLLKGISNGFSPLSIKDVSQIPSQELKNLAMVQELSSHGMSGMYEEYLCKGQFPEAALFSENKLVSDYIRGSVLKKILIEDGPAIFKIDKVGEFSSIYKIISKESGSIFEILNLAREVGSAKTLSTITCTIWIIFFF